MPAEKSFRPALKNYEAVNLGIEICGSEVGIHRMKKSPRMGIHPRGRARKSTGNIHIYPAHKVPKTTHQNQKPKKTKKKKKIIIHPPPLHQSNGHLDIAWLLCNKPTALLGEARLIILPHAGM